MILFICRKEDFMAVAIKEKRIEFRVPDEAKRIIEDAARLSNVSLSSYILSVTLKQARIDLSQNETIILNNQERDALMNALSKPTQPNEDLKELFK